MSAWLTGARALALALSLTLACGTVTGTDDKPKSQRILECLIADRPTRLRVDPLVATVRDPAGGTKEYRWQIYARERGAGNDLAVRVTAPEDFAGTAYLVRRTESERQIYVRTPALGGVRRVEEGPGTGPTILGTNLTINDAAGMAAKLRRHLLTVLDEETVLGRTTDRLVATPPPNSEAPYSRITAHVARDPCVVLRLETSRDGKRLRVYEADPDSLRQLDGGTWYAGEWTIRDERDGQITTLRFGHVEDSPDFDDGRFDPDSFYR